MKINDLRQYDMMPEWDAKSLPSDFRQSHNIPAGTWAKLTISSGKLRYDVLDEDGNCLDSTVYDNDSEIALVEPKSSYRVEPLSEDLRCQLSYYCLPEDYYQKKYGLSATHSEALEIPKYIQSGKALDFGCGSGRNSLYLQRLGFDVTAFDKNAGAIEQLNNIIGEESLEHIKAYVDDAHTATFTEKYDLIVSTVVLMFLQEKNIPDIIENIQNSTTSGGYNVVVCAIDSNDYPMSAHQLPFLFSFTPGELKHYYRDWHIAKYNEDIGHLCRLDEHGNPIALRFATLIAQKN